MVSQDSSPLLLDYASAKPRSTLSLLRNRNFILLWFAYGISALGDHLSEMGVLKLQHALDPGITHATRISAGMTLAFMLPFFLFGPVCGWLADRFPRKWLMIAADLVRALLVFEAVLILSRLESWVSPSAEAGAAMSMGVAVLPLFALGLFAAVFAPARLSLLPTLIHQDQLTRANALTAGLGMIATIASAPLGGWLVSHYQLVWNFRVDAFTFLASAALICFIRPPKTPSQARGESGFAALAEGFRYVRAHRRIIEVIAISMLLWSAAGVVRSTIPALVKTVFGGSYQDLGIYQGVLGLGLVVGSIMLSLFGESLRSEIAAAWSLKLAGVAGLILAATVQLHWHARWVAIGLFFVGFFGAGIQVGVVTLLQRLTPNYVRGRIFGVHDLCSMVGLLLATSVLGLPDWKNIDQHIAWILGLAAIGLIAGGIRATHVRLRRSRYGPGLTFWRNFTEFYCRFWSRARREGLCTIPAHGPVIVAANHNSTLDPFLLIATSPNRHVSFMVAREYAEFPGFRKLTRLAECVPVNRSGVDTASVKAALRHLSEGKVLGIFPQGRVQHPDEPIDLREGVGMLALRSGAAVIPAYVCGVSYSPGTFWPFLRRQRAVVRYGRPVDLSPWRGREKDREAYHEAAQAVQAAVWELKPHGPPDERTDARRGAETTPRRPPDAAT